MLSWRGRNTTHVEGVAVQEMALHSQVMLTPPKVVHGTCPMEMADSIQETNDIQMSELQHTQQISRTGKRTGVPFGNPTLPDGRTQCERTGPL